jgi:hypothetical protein
MLDDFLPFLIVIFVVVNFVRGFLQNRSRGPQPQPARRTRPKPSEPSTATTRTDAPATPAESQSPFDELERRIQEATRRVQDAQGRPSQTPDSPPPPPPATGPATVKPPTPPATPQPAPKPTGFLGREGVPQTKPKPPQVRSLPTRRVAQSDRPAKVVFSAANASANDLVRGIVWSEVLSGPKAAPHLRRSASTQRSR